MLPRQERRVSREDAKIGAKAAKQPCKDKEKSDAMNRLKATWTAAGRSRNKKKTPAKQTRRISFVSAVFFAAFAPIFASLRETPFSRFGRGRSVSEEQHAMTPLPDC